MTASAADISKTSQHIDKTRRTQGAYDRGTNLCSLNHSRLTKDLQMPRNRWQTCADDLLNLSDRALPLA